MGRVALPRATEVEALERTTDYVLATADLTRRDRLWPADPQLFRTNPLSVAYGASGTALFLQHAGVLDACPADVVDWIRGQPLLVERYPPGLYSGLAGIACALWQLGAREEARVAMEVARRSPLLFAEPHMLDGAAGWGWASLYLHGETADPVHLDWAVRAGEHLVRTAEREENGYWWPLGADDRIHHGFGYGASGIALFLAQLHRATGRDDFRVAAARAFRLDLAAGVETENGRLWPRYRDDTIVRPYWIEGAAGVGAVAIRLAELLEEPWYRDVAVGIAEEAFVTYSVSPGLFSGLAGIAELMLDMLCATGDEVYRERAQDMTSTLSLFAIERPSGLAWPGRMLDKIANDYATGAAGIGLFLARLRRPGPRLLVDLPALTASGPAYAMTPDDKPPTA